MNAPLIKQPKRVWAALANTVWAIQPEKLQAILDFLELRAQGVVITAAELDSIRVETPEPRLIAADGAGGGGPKGAIAVLPVFGVLGHRMGMSNENSGGTSTERLALAFDDFLNDPTVGTIILDISSPGGEVQGTAEFAEKVFAAREQKRIVAIANANAASGAFWIGTAASEFVATPTGQVGSMGVFMLHSEQSEADAAAGVKHTIIRAGRFKAEGNPLEPLTDDARAAIQRMVDTSFDMFVAAVARNRGVTQSIALSDFGEGRVLDPKRALKAGMIDRVATLDETIARLSSGGRLRRSPRRRTRAATEKLRLEAEGVA
jgi:signal peptide peptidase SppA